MDISGARRQHSQAIMAIIRHHQLQSPHELLTPHASLTPLRDCRHEWLTSRSRTEVVHTYFAITDQYFSMKLQKVLQIFPNMVPVIFSYPSFTVRTNALFACIGSHTFVIVFVNYYRQKKCKKEL